MAAIFALLVIAGLSLLVVRVASTALTLTGMSPDAARLQAQSAFTGVGFTTNESEMITRDPARRRVIRLLMLLGNVGFTGVLASLVISFLSADNTGDQLLRLGAMVAGVGALWLVSRTRRFNDWLDRTMRRMLERAGVAQPTDYARLLRIRRGYTIAEIDVEDGDWLQGRALDEARPGDEGVMILGVERSDGTYLGVPSPKTRVEAGDRLTVYGEEDALRALAERRETPEGEEQHDEAMQEARDRRAREAREDRRRKEAREESRQRDKGDAGGGIQIDDPGEGEDDAANSRNDRSGDG